METIKRTGKIYARTNTGNTVKLLISISCVLIVLVCSICVFAIFWRVPLSGSHLHQSGKFYYSLTGKTVKIDSYIDTRATVFDIPEFIYHAGSNYKVTAVSSNAFANKKNLEKITFPNSVTKIESASEAKSGAFSGCINLTEIVWGNGLSHIGEFAFYNCIALQELKIPYNIQVISNYAFGNCSGLESIEISGNTILNKDVFSSCENIKQLKLGEDVGLGLNNQTFSSMSNLMTFSVDAKNDFYKVVGNCLLSLDGQTLILGGKGESVPVGVSRIADYAFSSRYPVQDIYLSSSVVEVGENSFASGVIFTNSTSKPDGWKTLLPIKSGATKIDFYRNYDSADTTMVSWYIYSGSKSFVFPDFEEMFGEAPAGHEFTKWEERTEGYYACFVTKENLKLKLTEYSWIIETSGEDFQPDNLASFTDSYTLALQVSLSTESTQDQVDKALYDLTNTYSKLERTTPDFGELDIIMGLCNGILNNKEQRMKYKISVWEDFKSVCKVAEEIRANSESTKSEIRSAIAKLANQYYKFSSDDISILESQDWKVGLANLIAVADELEESDFDGTNWQNFRSLLSEAKNVLSGEDVQSSVGETAWKDLRGAFESLIPNNVKLKALVLECDKLLVNDYTNSSWVKFADQLNKAKSITTTDTTRVRKELLESKNNLIAKQEIIDSLEELLTICEVLKQYDYLGDWQALQTALLPVKNKPWKNTEISKMLADLESAYKSLTAIETNLSELNIWITICENLQCDEFTNVSWLSMSTKLNDAKKLDQHSAASEVQVALAGLQTAYGNLILSDKPIATPNIFLTVGTSTYFIIAVILFSGAIISLSFAYSLKKSVKRN